MLAKAAASATAPKIQGSVYLDHTDIKYLQYSISIQKLEQLIHVCKLLLKTLNLRKNEFIVPLTPIVVALVAGFPFNVSAIIEKRVQLLSQSKICKQEVVKLSSATTTLKLTIPLTPVESECNDYVTKLYNKDLQTKVLIALQTVAQNALDIHQSRFQQVLIERDSSRPLELLGRASALDVVAFSDLITPHELAFGLDLLAIIRNKSEDTTPSAFFTLAFTILEKFQANLSDKCVPPIRTYYTSIMKLTKSKGAFSHNILIQLPYWQYTMHRIYAVTLRIKDLIDTVRAVLRQLYLPNKTHFGSDIVKLQTGNLYEYDTMLAEVELFCTSQRLEHELLRNIDAYSSHGASYQVHFNNINNAYQALLLKSVQHLRQTTRLVDTLCTNWKTVLSNMKKFEMQELDPEELTKLVQEKLQVDRLVFTERQKQIEQTKLKLKSKDVSGSQNPKLSSSRLLPISARRNSISPSISSTSSTSSSISSSPVSLSPLKLSRTPSVSKTSDSSMFSSPTHFLDSNGTIAQKRGQPIRTRSRSSSLQSEQNHSFSPSSRTNDRSNSLQTASLHNMKIVQSRYAQSSSSPTSKIFSKANASAASALQKEDTDAPVKTKSRSTSVKKLVSSKLNDSDEIDANEQYFDLYMDNQTLVVSKTIPAQEDSSTAFTNAIPTVTVSMPDDNEHSEQTHVSESILKKVRFTGVPPMSADENPEPKRRGWYKKPAVLRYPPPPSQYPSFKTRPLQEGLVFRSSLLSRDLTDKRLSNEPVTGSKLLSGLRDKLIK